nr:zinc finger, CCHC-type [Tanacetum cinerariifolium]
MNVAIQVSCIIDKLPSSWKDFKHTLKYKKEELTLVELGSHLRIEESLRAQDNDKPKSNNIADGCEDMNGDLDKEAPKQWHQKFNEVVLSNDYLHNQADKCVYSKFDEIGKRVIICLYVDGMLIFGTNQVWVELSKEFLLLMFSMKDMEEADVIFSTRIKHESNRIAISQSHYIENAVSQLEYSRVIGCLMYVMNCTRPDIAFVVGKLSRVGRLQAGSATLKTIHLQVVGYSCLVVV